MSELNILIIDEDIVSVKLLKNMLQKQSQCRFHLTETTNAYEAAAILKSNQEFNAIIIDLNLSGIDGIEMLRILKVESKLTNIPVIITTSDETKKAEALKFGASGFLVKPIHLEQFNAQIEAIIALCSN